MERVGDPAQPVRPDKGQSAVAALLIASNLSSNPPPRSRC